MVPLSLAPRQVTPESLAIEQGIKLLDILDRDLIATFLLRRRVSFPVIVRVLDPRGRRRPA